MNMQKMTFILLSAFLGCYVLQTNISYADSVYTTCPMPAQLYKISQTNGINNAIFDTSHGWVPSPWLLKLNNLPNNFATTIQFKSVSIDRTDSGPHTASFIQINCYYILKEGRVLSVTQNVNAKAYADHWWKDKGDNGPYPFSSCGIPIEDATFVPVTYCKFVIVPS